MAFGLHLTLEHFLEVLDFVHLCSTGRSGYSIWELRYAEVAKLIRWGCILGGWLQTFVIQIAGFSVPRQRPMIRQ